MSPPSSPNVSAGNARADAPPTKPQPSAPALLTRPQNDRSFLYNLFFGPGGGATFAGMCEIIIFHPFDTVAKRLMSYHHRVVDLTSPAATWRNLDHVVFGKLKEHYTDATTGAVRHISSMERLKHMYPGSSYAVAYKVLQRIMKFAGQPYMRDYLHVHHSNVFFKKDTRTGEYVRGGRGAMTLEATAGCLVGVCEIVLLPFDRMKVLNQTNKAAVHSRNMFSVILTEGVGKLYAGALTTAVRNATGSFLLFGGTAFTKEYVFQLENYRDATFAQNIAASTVGGCVGVFFTSPMDVIKTRIQSQRLTDKMSGWQVFVSTVRREGFAAFYKGITPKMITTAPRLVFSYTMTQYFTKKLRGE
ncbi:putative mitochondrial mitochondrial carrier protein (MCP13) [Leptomonas pyrrhocoris]|uniref:Putative mitochondrial mitochondrial carrier protein (MCP13) n=1 Tax=Leptomonas pyrrhocoris TaxID=157538 RepID=A0A0N0VGY2_LEPPY|nr:putative mitochondrial mitochondrial carrier protein (MCP13) [Leptomonas pyrrhocoris]XP_015662701.1 putative mitochondrial mitochondrial carrier protein (MCP13) [Leptomonas pyrrhocoris]XP_015662702.1 putative mitochondrial mitochondrial carrier protein (MCP13) [Leptomonas pyrrhocoris]KPA84261.1 putative mitochondrial mitochondrial carrier protein (MCP13) [Leptomonas pyrrhocoris]KPA84262.1 putative mitochondrial mitochondrial carrier protein (MCP13) [Leptomonas pyrrhocoris]KPA84263.1 putativ|eukprot:XP_015662700.1 putative mitochondrial mitochondrial carrier protein (MCP13) [Leptomonas pyrrhocoris]